MTIKSFLTTVVVIIILILPQRLYAQQKTVDSIKTIQLVNVEITGRRQKSYRSNYSFFGSKTETPIINIPQSISAVTKELIKDKMEFTLKDATNNVSGITDYSGYDEYTIRGFRAENAKYINGLRGYNSTYTSAMLVNVERVEIIKGPTSTLYGNCDPGGTINMVTKKPLDIQEGEFAISSGTWNHFRAVGDITGPINKNKTFLYRINAGYDKTNSFRNEYYAESYQIAPSLSFIPNDKLRVNIDFTLTHINTIMDRGQPGLQYVNDLKSTSINLSISQPGDYLHETDFSSIASFSYKFNNYLSFNSGFLHFNTWQNASDHGINRYISPDSVSLFYTKWDYQTATNTLSTYLSYQFNTGKINHQLIVGYDYVENSVKPLQQYFELPDQFGLGSGIVGTFSLVNPQHFKRAVSTYQLSDFNSDSTNVNVNVYQTQGVYLQDLLSWKNWKLLVSLREELYKGSSENDTQSNVTETIFLPRAGLVYSITPHISLYATYNNGFDPFEVSNSLQVFNEPFKPITSQLFEAGLKTTIFKDRLSFVAAIYQLTVNNVAVNANNVSNPNLYIQQGTDRSRGIELEANGNILSNLSVSLAYAYCKAEILDSKIASQIGTLLENSPRNSSSSWIKYTFNHGVIQGLGIAGGHTQASSRNTLDIGFTLPGYVVFNAGLYYRIRQLSLSAILNNVTNKVYWTGAYNYVNKWPGRLRNFMVELAWNFGK